MELMNERLLIARGEQGAFDLYVDSQMINRHGLITGASGTGKTLTLQVMAQQFSRIGVPVFIADVKGDVAGLSQPGELTPALTERAGRLGFDGWDFYGAPVTF